MKKPTKNTRSPPPPESSGWIVEISDVALKETGKLDRQVQRCLWRCRVGDYRLICSLEDDCLVVPVLQVGHGKEVYRQ